MTQEEICDCIEDIEKAIQNYSTYYIDWERLYYEPGYKPMFPVDITSADLAVKKLKEVFKEREK